MLAEVAGRIAGVLLEVLAEERETREIQAVGNLLDRFGGVKQFFLNDLDRALRDPFDRRSSADCAYGNGELVGRDAKLFGVLRNLSHASSAITEQGEKTAMQVVILLLMHASVGCQFVGCDTFDEQQELIDEAAEQVADNLLFIGGVRRRDVRCGNLIIVPKESQAVVGERLDRVQVEVRDTVPCLPARVEVILDDRRREDERLGFEIQAELVSKNGVVRLQEEHLSFANQQLLLVGGDGHLTFETDDDDGEVERERVVVTERDEPYVVDNLHTVGGVVHPRALVEIGELNAVHNY